MRVRNLMTLSKAIHESSTPVALSPKARLGVRYLVKLAKATEVFLCPLSGKRARELFPALLESKSNRRRDYS